MEPTTYTVGNEPQIHLLDCGGPVLIEPGEDQTIHLEAQGQLPAVTRQGDTLTIKGAVEGVRLRVPAATTAELERVTGNLTVRGIRSLTVDGAGGDVEVEQIADAVRLRDLGADLQVRHAATLRVEDGPRRERRVRDVAISDVGAVEIDNAGRNCVIDDVADTVRYRNIGAHLTVRAAGRVTVVGGNVGGDLTLHGVGRVEVANIGANAEVHGVQGDARFENIGANCEIDGIAGQLAVGHIGGNATIRRAGGVRQIGNAGGNLVLENASLATDAFPPAGLRIAVGGNARIELPEEADILIEAMVGGVVKVDGGERAGPGPQTLRYGAGTVRLHIIAGGNVELLGGGTPKVSGGWKDSFGPNFFGKEFFDAGFGKAWKGHFGSAFVGAGLGRMGGEIGRAVAEAVSDIGVQVQEAVAGAQSARERGQQGPSTGRGHSAAATATAPPPATGRTGRLDAGARAERELVLRMVADGRITPEQGAALLDALS